MGIFDGLRKAIGIGGGGKGEGADRGIYYYVRCDKCGEAIRIRVDPYWDLGEGDGGFSVTKHVIGQKCFRPIEVTIDFDSGRKEIDKAITGGKFISAEEYAAQLPPASPTPPSSS